MEDNLDIPEESMRHIEALLARHPPHLIQRMFSQTLESRTCDPAARTPICSLTVPQVVVLLPLLSCPQPPRAPTRRRLRLRHGVRDFP
jgi:hypothetical protein